MTAWQLIVGLLVALGGAVLAVAKADLEDEAVYRWLARKLIYRAARRLPEDERDRWRDEGVQNILDLPGRLPPLLWALDIYIKSASWGRTRGAPSRWQVLAARTRAAWQRLWSLPQGRARGLSKQRHPAFSPQTRIHLVKGEQLALRDGVPVLHVPGGPRIDPGTVFEQLWNERAIPDTPGVRHTIQSEPLSAPVLRVDGQAEWRDVDLQIVYEIDRRAWLGQFTPNQCQGLVDYLDNNAFTASHLPIGEIPTERNDQWVEIDDPDDVAVRVRGTLVSTIGYKITPGAFTHVATTVTPPGLPPERLH